MTRIEAGSIIGILGGGQLGRMLAVTAAQLGYKCHIYDPAPQPPAGDVSAYVTTAGYADLVASRAFADAVDVITYEFENVPVDAVEALAKLKPVAPSAKALQVAQDRYMEKCFALEHGGSTAPFVTVNDHDELVAACHTLGTPAILKTRRMGYDGKGQVRLNEQTDVADAWLAIGKHPAILEGVVNFECEISVIIARGYDGKMCVYGPVQNVHKNAILESSVVPSTVNKATADHAILMAQNLATALDHVGVLTVEMFVCDGKPIFNEIAPRVHNSGHWTIEGAVTSQFENHIRAICGLPLGNTDPRGTVFMQNIIGDAYHDRHKLLADPKAHVHLYGKTEVRPGRKMGHVTWVK